MQKEFFAKLKQNIDSDVEHAKQIQQLSSTV